MATLGFVTGLSEVALAVRDVAASARFYTEVVGLTPEEPAADWGASFMLGPPTRQQRLILLSRSLPPLDQRREAPAAVGASASAGSVTSSFTPAQLGRTHFALRVPRGSLEQAVDRVRRHGVEVSGPAYFGWMKATAHYFFDPDGHVVEFWSPDVEPSE